MMRLHQHQRQFLGLGHLSNISSARYYTLPPRKSYNANRTAIQLYLSRVPSAAKYFGGVILSAYSLIHLHPNTIITLGPPIGLGSYYLYKRWMRKQRNAQILKIIPPNKSEFQKIDDRIRIKAYDETDVYNVLNGMENQYDHFKRQVIEITERKIIDHVMLNTEASNSSLFIDKNQQVSINVDENEIETFIKTKIPIPASFISEEETTDVNESKTQLNMVKLSIPFYSNKDVKTRKRMGIFEVYLLELPADETAQKNQYLDYKIYIEVTPYSVFSASPALTVRNSDGYGIYKSKILQESSNKKRNEQNQEDEEITININS